MPEKKHAHDSEEPTHPPARLWIPLRTTAVHSLYGDPTIREPIEQTIVASLGPLIKCAPGAAPALTTLVTSPPFPSAHNPKVAGSNPAPATTNSIEPRRQPAEAFLSGTSRVHPQASPH